VEILKTVSQEQRLSILKNEVGYYQKKEYPTRQALSLSELNQMKPHVDFESHSKYHPILTQLNDDECWEEISTSKIHLKKLLCRGINHFKFPNGDYGEREIIYVKKAGYLSSLTNDFGWNEKDVNPYKLKSIVVDDDASVNILSAQIYGLFHFLRYARYRIKKAISSPFLQLKSKKTLEKEV
jgi:hypothetical protein